MNLSNVELRQCESVIQKSLNCAKDESYYNRSNASFKGYIDLTKEQKRRRYEILKNGRLTWLKNGGKTIQSKLSNYENWTKKYGKEVADQKLKEQRKRKSGNRNGMFKYNDQQKNEIKELYLTGLYTRVNISKMTGVNYSTVKNLLTGIKGLRKKENLIKTL